MMCTMCPTVILSDKREPRRGWQCVCGEVNCVHMLVCSRCEARRYILEKKGLVVDGRAVKQSGE